PKRYGNYENFKNERVTNELAERLKIFCEFRKLYNQPNKSTESENRKETYLSLRERFDDTEIALRANIETINEPQLLNSIFSTSYNRKKIKIDHIIDVATVLYGRSEGERKKQENIKIFLDKLK